MLLRLALLLPPTIFALLIVALVPLTDQTTRTGLTEANRLWFYLTLPPLYAVLSVYVSSIYVAWFGGWHRLPAWVRAFMRSAETTGPDLRVEGGVESLARTMPLWARFRLAVGVFIEGLWWLAMSIPYAILLLWLRRGVYAPWEAAMVAAAGVATLAWLVLLAYRLRT
jgi:hypothetical protein